MVQFGINGNPAVTSAWRNTQIKDDPVKQGNKRGYVSFAALPTPNSRTTQVFINYADNSKDLDSQRFAAFGQVISGMDVVDKIYSRDGQKPNPGRIQSEGNAYLVKEFPKLDFIQKATIVK
jgi:peptidyl-prolyl cis-trans isomerase A (cyclophilin A)